MHDCSHAGHERLAYWTGTGDRPEASNMSSVIAALRVARLRLQSGQLNTPTADCGGSGGKAYRNSVRPATGCGDGSGSDDAPTWPLHCTCQGHCSIPLQVTQTGSA